MGGALGYVDLDEGVETTIESLEDWLSDYFGLEAVNWKVAFDRFGFIAVEDPSSDLLDIPVVARLTENIPEKYADDSGQIETSTIFPIGLHGPRERIDPEDTRGFETTLVRSIVELKPLESVSSRSKEVFESIVERDQSRGIVDGFGTAWSEHDSLLASKAAEHSSSVENPNVIVSFDVLRSLAYVFDHQDFLEFKKYDEGEVDTKDHVGFDRIIDAKPLAFEDLPEVDKVYIHQNRRVAASDHQISSQEIASELQGRVIRSRDSCTIPDPTDRGVRAQIGSVSKVVLDEDQEAYNGFVRVADDANISFVYDFYAALKVPEAPFLTNELAQETSDWDREPDHITGWSAADTGFALRTWDKRRDIRRQLFVQKYWVIRGEGYRKKRDFEGDVEILIEMIESELGGDVSWREFKGDRIKKTPILQSDVLDQIRKEVRGPPSQSDLVEAISKFTESSEDVEGINKPLFPSDLSEFVADTSVIDAQVISRLVAEGDLYGATVVVPEVVLEEIHRQVEQSASRGKLGLEELTCLRELSEQGILTLEVVEAQRPVDTQDNVAVDQALVRVAKQRGVPLCSADRTLLEFAEVAGATGYSLAQELSRWSTLIKNSLRQGELSISELIRAVYLQVEESKVSEDSVHRALFYMPNQRSQQDLATEMAIKEEIDRLQRRGELYKQGDRVGLKKRVAIVPSLDAIENGLISDKIEDGSLAESLELSSHEMRFEVVLPSSFEYWASLQPSQKYLKELHDLEDLEKSNEIRLEWREILPSETGLVLADEEQFSNLLQGVQRKTATEFDYTHAQDTASGSLMINY